MGIIGPDDPDDTRGGMKTTSQNFTPRRGEWDAGALFDGIGREDVALADHELADLESFFWFDLCAEWDSRHLHRHLHERGDEYTPEFLAFEEAWYADEINHAEGFLALHCLLFGEQRDGVIARLEAREPEFDELGRFFGDEFRLALLFAYDELATTRAYRLDVALYERLGHPVFRDWIRRLLRDEGYHHANAVEVIRRRHAHRMDEVAKHVGEFVEWDSGGHDYRATFLFDHEWDVEPGFFRENGEILVGRLQPA